MISGKIQKRYLPVLLACFIGLVFCLPCFASLSRVVYKISQIYSKPDGKIIGELPLGCYVYVSGKSQGWLKVHILKITLTADWRSITNIEEGWVKEQMLTAVKSDIKEKFKSECMDMLKSGSPEERRYAAEALGIMQVSDSVNVLIHAVDDPNTGVSYAAIKALGNIKDKRAVPILKKMLKGNNDFARAFAAGAVVKIGDKDQLEALEEALKDRTLGAKKDIASAMLDLGGISSRSMIKGIMKDLDPGDIIDIGLVIYRSGDESVVKECISAIEEMLTDSALIHTKPWDLETAFTKVIKIKSESLIPVLIEASKHRLKGIRKSAVYAMGEIGDKSVIPVLEECSLNDYDNGVQAEALVSIRKIKERHKR